MSEEKKEPFVLTEEHARKYLEMLKNGDKEWLTERMWVHKSRENNSSTEE